LEKALLIFWLGLSSLFASEFEQCLAPFLGLYDSKDPGEPALVIIKGHPDIVDCKKCFSIIYFYPPEKEHGQLNCLVNYHPLIKPVTRPAVRTTFDCQKGELSSFSFKMLSQNKEGKNVGDYVYEGRVLDKWAVGATMTLQGSELQYRDVDYLYFDLEKSQRLKLKKKSKKKMEKLKDGLYRIMQDHAGNYRKRSGPKLSLKTILNSYYEGKGCPSRVIDDHLLQVEGKALKVQGMSPAAQK
jgi:hypothetical protein